VTTHEGAKVDERAIVAMRQRRCFQFVAFASLAICQRPGTRFSLRRKSRTSFHRIQATYRPNKNTVFGYWIQAI